MAELAIAEKRIPAMTAAAVNKVRQLEQAAFKSPQIDISTGHLFHAGLYARTIMIPKGVLLTGALIKIATVLIISGDVIAYIGDATLELRGYNVLPASAHRKQAFFARSNTNMTMLFKSNADNFKAAEKQFTDEDDLLFSRNILARNYVKVTGEI